MARVATAPTIALLALANVRELVVMTTQLTKSTLRDLVKVEHRERIASLTLAPGPKLSERLFKVWGLPITQLMT